MNADCASPGGLRRALQHRMQAAEVGKPVFTLEEADRAVVPVLHDMQGQAVDMDPCAAGFGAGPAENGPFSPASASAPRARYIKCGVGSASGSPSAFAGLPDTPYCAGSATRADRERGMRARERESMRANRTKDSRAEEGSPARPASY